MFETNLLGEIEFHEHLHTNDDTIKEYIFDVFWVGNEKMPEIIKRIALITPSLYRTYPIHNYQGYDEYYWD